MRYKNVIKPIAFMMGLLLLLEGVSYPFTPKSNSKDIVTGEPKNTLDYLLIGDSECYSSVSPMEIWKTYGYAGYNYGVMGQRLQDTYYQLEKALRCQSPKVILFEVGAVYTYYGFTKEAQYSVDSLAQNDFPLYYYHNRWKVLGRHNLDLSYVPDSSKPNPWKGFYYKTMVAPYTKGAYVNKSRDVASINKLPLFYLNKIVELCNKRHISLVLFFTPSTYFWTYSKHNSMADYAEKHNLTFLDLNLITDELGINWAEDTRDQGHHLNYFGAKKVTNYIGKYLSGNCRLTDHRQDKRYACWNTELEIYLKKTNQLVSSARQPVMFGRAPDSHPNHKPAATHP